MSRPRPNSSVHISDIVLNVRPQFGKTLDHIVFRNQTKSFAKEVPVTISPGSEHREVFEPALVLSVKDELLIKMRHPALFGSGYTKITVKLSEVNAQAQDDHQGKKVYFTFHNNVEVTIGLSSPPPQVPVVSPGQSDDSRGNLLPTTSDILRICPRFRLLIIGNTGVGKSTLIQRVFGVKDVNVASDKRGKADINHEFLAEENKLFVLHDSLGLEAASAENMDVIKRFIDGRRQKQHLKDQLHAIWVCLPIPFTGGRLLETGMEEFLKDRRRILGNIPVVIVLTKLDLVQSQLLLKGGNIDEDKTKFLEKHCTEPLVRAGAGDLPRVAVSTTNGFGLESTIPELVKTTTSAIERYVRSDKSYVEEAERSSLERDAQIYIAEMAQRGSIETNVELTITLGKKRYWKNLGASLTFSEKKVKEYILVIHEEVIQIWNFYDPEMALRGDDFKAALLDTSNLGVRDIQGPEITLGPMASVISVLAPHMISMYGAVVTIPIASAVLLAKMCKDIYDSTQTIVKRFMAYIVDLIYVMKVLFVLAREGSITTHDVALALKLYEKSAYRNRIHLEIRDFGTGMAILPGGRDSVMDKIEVLVRRFAFTDDEVVELRDRIQSAQRAEAQA